MVYLVAAFFWLSAGVMLRSTIRMWRDPNHIVRFTGRYGFKPDFDRGLARGFTAFTLSMTSLALAVPLIAYTDPARGVVRGPTWLAYVEGGLLLLFMLGLALQFCIAWFNRPKFLVPPQRRDEPGVWRERRARR
ncbi:hypothetical protein [Kutzneria sp. CA-103260]|uniref:hypothetical protein n=1 Tax=Kutzneria sp. CA-103260 TaxID=2802641 RepID=UPI001BA65CD4|nr:hypothetical protein [Kutzneria sp. CA-103260]QUQ66988.1 hypothetical protein JJ691_47160 [Kutzneria sp. CA-103260]